jgi:hypothetical protein
LQACKYIEEHLSIDTANLGKETLLNAAKTAMSSKIVDSESDFFATMVVDAVQVGPNAQCSHVPVNLIPAPAKEYADRDPDLHGQQPQGPQQEIFICTQLNQLKGVGP